MIRIIQTEKGAVLVITIAIVAVLLTAGLQLGHFAKNSINFSEKVLFLGPPITIIFNLVQIYLLFLPPNSF